ncbi:MAG: hypothetical protein ACK4TO_03860 [Candidatus Nitrosotenuis sp.]
MKNSRHRNQKRRRGRKEELKVRIEGDPRAARKGPRVAELCQQRENRIE